jgi:hypothetical protein
VGRYPSAWHEQKLLQISEAKETWIEAAAEAFARSQHDVCTPARGLWP